MNESCTAHILLHNSICVWNTPGPCDRLNEVVLVHVAAQQLPMLLICTKSHSDMYKVQMDHNSGLLVNGEDLDNLKRLYWKHHQKWDVQMSKKHRNFWVTVCVIFQSSFDDGDKGSSTVYPPCITHVWTHSLSPSFCLSAVCVWTKRCISFKDHLCTHSNDRAHMAKKSRAH